MEQVLSTPDGEPRDAPGQSMAGSGERVDLERFLSVLEGVRTVPFSGEFSPDGTFRAPYTGPGIHTLLGGDLPDSDRRRRVLGHAGAARRPRPLRRGHDAAARRRVVPDGVPHRGARRPRALDPRVHARDDAGGRQRPRRRHRHRRHRPARERRRRERVRGRAEGHARAARVGALRDRRVPLRLALPGLRAPGRRLRVDADGDISRHRANRRRRRSRTGGWRRSTPTTARGSPPM